MRIVKPAFILAALLLLTGLSEVPAVIETEASMYKGDSVDDIVVWIHPDDPAKSLIIATLKRSNVRPPEPTGLLTYDLNGKQIQFLPDGTPNNIDLRPDFHWQGETFDLIISNHWYSNEVTFYKIDSSTLQLVPLLNHPLPTGLSLTRGLCMYRNGNRFDYFVVSNDGLIHQYRVTKNDNELSARRVRRIKLDSRAEGCVVDDDNHTLYVAEESEGIWRMDARPDRGNKRKLVDSISYFGDLYRDIEGVTLYKKTGGEGYLIASSQRRNRFVVYDRRTNHRLGAFTISESANTDAVTYTDGIFATSTYLGPKFPDGLFIAQDNDNTDKGQEKTGQNFKIVDWRDLQPVLDGFEK